MRTSVDSDPGPGDEFLTIRELAVYLRVSVKTLYRWRHVGSGPPAHVFGGQLRYRRTDLELWLEQSRDE